MSHGIIIGMTAGDLAHREHFIRQQGTHVLYEIKSDLWVTLADLCITIANISMLWLIISSLQT